MSNSSIWTIDMIHLGSTTPSRVEQEAMLMKEYSVLPKAPELLELHHKKYLISYPGHM